MTGLQPSNKPQLLAVVNANLGDYLPVEDSDSQCQAASLQILNTSTGGFSLGRLIDFSALHNGTQTKKIADFCLVTTQLKYVRNGIIRSQRYNRCKNKDDEGSVVDSVMFKEDGQIVYTLSKPALKCVFVKQ
ncbi:hypothetical protein [Pseudoalteromonas mariniglutinosa]|uniref:hypothetical protein n=1 Tax=Pseudoalteromonas mariniglutinosa TaxID=206042 RepID=UPI00384BFAB6